jgi:hypothetical protein
VGGLVQPPPGVFWLRILAVGALCVGGIFVAVYAAEAPSIKRQARVAEVVASGGAADASRSGTREQPAKVEVPFDRTLELHGIRFRVTSTNDASISRLKIVPSGLEIDNSVQTHEVDGFVVGAEVADLDADGSPEIYVYVASAGSGSYGSLVAYSANRRKSLSVIHLAPLSEHEAASQGYMGHDEFAVAGSVLVRRFPVYRATDANARPTGGTRQLEYRLERGEAGWLLKLYRALER